MHMRIQRYRNLKFENRILVYPGANHVMKPAEFQNPDECFGPSRPDLLVSQLELHRETIEALLLTAKKAGIDTLLNPSPAHFLADSVYQGLTHLILNETEAAILTGRRIEELTPDFKDWTTITDEFIELGVKHVVLTLGAQGAFYSEEKGKGELIPAVKIDQDKVCDTSGAGYVCSIQLVVAQNSFLPPIRLSTPLPYDANLYLQRYLRRCVCYPMGQTT